MLGIEDLETIFPSRTEFSFRGKMEQMRSPSS